AFGTELSPPTETDCVAVALPEQSFVGKSSYVTVAPFGAFAVPSPIGKPAADPPTIDVSWTALPSGTGFALSTTLPWPSLTVVETVEPIFLKVFVNVQTIASASAASVTPFGTAVPLPLTSGAPFFVHEYVDV